jgi:hypothetical protein
LAWWSPSSCSEATARTVSATPWEWNCEFERLPRLRRKESSKEEERFLLMIPRFTNLIKELKGM